MSAKPFTADESVVLVKNGESWLVTAWSFLAVSLLLFNHSLLADSINFFLVRTHVRLLCTRVTLESEGKNQCGLKERASSFQMHQPRNRWRVVFWLTCLQITPAHPISGAWRILGFWHAYHSAPPPPPQWSIRKTTSFFLTRTFSKPKLSFFFLLMKSVRAKRPVSVFCHFFQTISEICRNPWSVTKLCAKFTILNAALAWGQKAVLRIKKWVDRARGKAIESSEKQSRPSLRAEGYEWRPTNVAEPCAYAIEDDLFTYFIWVHKRCQLMISCGISSRL